MAKTFNRTIELKSLVTPDVLSPEEAVKTRKKEVKLPRRRSPERPEPDPKDAGLKQRDQMRDVFQEWLMYMRKQKQKWERLVRFRYLL